MTLLKAEDFEPWLGKKVRVATVPQPVELVLARIQRNPELDSLDAREPFILFFEAPLDVYLIDAAYEFDCGRGGPYHLDIAQMPPSKTKRHYQAMFN